MDKAAKRYIGSILLGKYTHGKALSLLPISEQEYILDALVQLKVISENDKNNIKDLKASEVLQKMQYVDYYIERVDN